MSRYFGISMGPETVAVDWRDLDGLRLPYPVST